MSTALVRWNDTPAIVLRRVQIDHEIRKHFDVMCAAWTRQMLAYLDSPYTGNGFVRSWDDRAPLPR